PISYKPKQPHESSTYTTRIRSVGAGHITNDLAIGLKTSIDAAEKIKLKYVRAYTPKANLSEKIRIEELEGDENVVTRKELQNIADRKRTSLNSSQQIISYAVFC